MVQALYREWRPLGWSEIVGQEHVVRTLQNAVAADRLSHAYLFSGPRGTGKTSTARILAKAANCLDDSLEVRPCNQCAACVAVNEGRYLDLIEIDAASNTSVDDVRDLRDRINFAPNEGRFKVYIIDEVHMLSTAAFNALLKTLEEPPPHAIFILATTEVHKVPATVLSRCQRHEFRRIPADEIYSYLEQQIKDGGYDVEPEALRLISRQATGSLRDAISLLDQLVSMGEAVTLDMAQEVLGTAVDEAVVDLVQALADGEAGKGLEIINQAVDGGIDPRQFARQIVEWLRSLLLIDAGEPVDGSEAAMAEQAAAFGSSRILTAMRAFSTATRGERTAWQPGLALELAFMESMLAEPDPTTKDHSESPGAPSKSAGRRRTDAESASADPMPEVEGAATSPAEPSGSEAQTSEDPSSASSPDEQPGSEAQTSEESLGASSPAEQPGSEAQTSEDPSGASSPDEQPGSEAQTSEDPSGASSPAEQPGPEAQTSDGSSGASSGPDTEAQSEVQGRLEDGPTAANPTAAAAAASPEFQRVLVSWPELLAAAYQRDPQTQALLNSCKPLGVDGSALVLGFQSDLLREKMEKGHSQQIVSESLAEVLEAEMDVRCVLIQDWGGDAGSAPTPPLPEGGMVAAALRDLGAEVVDYGPETEAEAEELTAQREDSGAEENLEEER